MSAKETYNAEAKSNKLDRAKRKYAKEEDQCTTIIREVEIIRAAQTIPEGDTPYTCRILASSPEPDGHRTQMDIKTTLPNIRDDASAGAIACHAHNKEVPYGSTSNGEMTEDGKVYCDFNVERNLDINHKDAPYSKSENLIRMISKGHIKKASVGSLWRLV